MFLHNESEGKLPKAPQKSFSDAVEEVVLEEDEELASAEPLLTLQASATEHANPPATPVQPPVKNAGDSSPVVLSENPQLDVEVETEVDVSLEEAEEARESPLHKRLSMSLITCREGETSSQTLAEVHHDATSSPVPGAEAERVGDGADHSHALTSLAVEPETPDKPSLPAESDGSPAQESPARSEKAEPEGEESEELPEESASPPAPEPASVPSPEKPKPQPSTGIRCPTFDPKSPSQVVFKPQWLGKGFGASGLRARGVQRGKGGSSPLAVRMAVKKVAHENKRRSGKLNQKGVYSLFFFFGGGGGTLLPIYVYTMTLLEVSFYLSGTEGRSPLQMLKGTNSPREQRPQVLFFSSPLISTLPIHRNL